MNTPNTYIYFRDDFEKITQQFDPLEVGCLAVYGYSYIEGVLRNFEKNNPNAGLIFYVTAWTVHYLPSYGANVIAIIMQDEWSREAKYRDKVGAVFRTCGLAPSLVPTLKHGSILELSTNVLSFLRTVSKDGISGRIRSCLLKTQGKKLAPLYDIPLGFYANEPVEYTPFDERPNILSFAGSIQHRVAKTRVPSPKTLARQRMVQALQSCIANNPKLPIVYRETSCYKASVQNTASYCNEMMNSKFCLVPRGANLETFRFYEAIRFGCIPIIEHCPDLPYYKNAPLVKLNDWSQLETTLLSLLDKPDVLRQMHQDALAWWHNVCAETTIAEQLSSHCFKNTHVYAS